MNRLAQEEQYCSILLKYLLSTTMRQSSISSLSASIQSIRKDCELLKHRIDYWEVLGLSYKVMDKTEDAWPPTLRESTSEKEAIQTHYLLARVRAKEASFPNQIFIQGQFHNLIWQPSRALWNQRQFPFWWFNLPWKARLLEATEHLTDNHISGDSTICWTKTLHGSNIHSTTPLEESVLLFLIKAGYTGSLPDVVVMTMQPPLKSCLADELLDSF